MVRNRQARRFTIGLSVAGLFLQAAWAVQVQSQTTTNPTVDAAARQSAPTVDWSKAVVESTMKRYPTATELGSWGYAKALFLMGEYLVWKRTGDGRYLQYIRDWVDSHVDAQGNLDHGTENLDAMLPGNLLLLLYQETGEERYKLAADKIRQRLNTYPRTADGGFWHANTASRQHQLWGDGVFMSMPFLVRYGRLFGESASTNDEAAKQLIVYASHLRSPEGLLYHAYDESGAATWADPATHHSSEFWCRAMGWFGMTLIDVLDALPANDSKRPQLIAILQDLVRGLAKYQDSQTGLWYQVVDKGSTPGNWLETSSSSMYSYVISVAVKRGYVDKKYEAVARKGYNGVMTKISLGDDGMANITDICEGTNVSDLAYYFARKRNVNDFHGLGAFLIVNEYFRTGQSAMELTRPSRRAVQVRVTNPSGKRRVENVVLRVAEIQRAAPGFHASSAVVVPDGEQAAGGAADPASQLPSQADDLDGDGKPDELAFQIELQPRQTRMVTITYGGPAAVTSPRADYPKRTDAKFAKHYDGMGWESETTAWRLYFDQRNAIDLWGKRKPGLYLEMFSAPDYKYQEESPLGRDIYNVGKSLGAGGVGAWIDGHAMPVAEVADRKWRIISAGPVRAMVEFTYEGWKIGDRVLTLRSRIAQWAGERGYEHQVVIDRAEDFPLVAGISRKPGLKEVDGNTCSLAIWGPQVVKPGTGATDSLPNENLGLAIIVPDGHQGCRREGDPLNYVVQPQLKDHTARWYVLAAWDQEAKPLMNVKDFTTLVQQETARLAQPASIVILSNPQAANASSPQGGTPVVAPDTVKYFSAADVRASFEKGSPLINKDGRGYSVITGRREKPGQSELHEKDIDVFYVIQGSATFVTGGKMLDPKPTGPGEVRGSGIEGGQTQTLSKDDVIVIPAGVPHWFKDMQGTFLYFVVKTQAP